MEVPLTKAGSTEAGACRGGRIINSLLLSLGLWYVYTEISTRLKLRQQTGLAEVWKLSADKWLSKLWEEMRLHRESEFNDLRRSSPWTEP